MNTEKVFLVQPAKSPAYEVFTGKYVTLKKLQRSDVESLYKLTHGSDYLEQVWDYLPYGPFSTCNKMKECFEGYLQKQLTFCVYDNKTKQAIGITCLLNIDPEMASIEIGGITYAKDYQKTEANTESTYMLLEYCFEVLGYRRVTWKCNNENQPSKNAAQRLGFEFEGLFMNHMIVKGENRNTAWFGIVDKRWPMLSLNYKLWLNESNKEKRSSLRQLNGEVECFSLLKQENWQLQQINEGLADLESGNFATEEQLKNLEKYGFTLK